MKTCKIQWVDDQGRPTPDENPAIGEAYLVEHMLYGTQYVDGKVHIEESEHFPICAEHAQRLKGHEMRYWRFVPYQTTSEIYQNILDEAMKAKWSIEECGNKELALEHINQVICDIKSLKDGRVRENQG